MSPTDKQIDLMYRAVIAGQPFEELQMGEEYRADYEQVQRSVDRFRRNGAILGFNREVSDYEVD